MSKIERIIDIDTCANSRGASSEKEDGMSVPVISVETHAHSLGVSPTPESVFEVPQVPNNDPFAGERRAYYEAQWARQDAERRMYERGE